MSDWLKRKHELLEKAAADASLRGLPLAVAVLLVVRYLNSSSETAWPSVGRLADDLGSDRRSIRRALARLVAAGLLCRERGACRANVYALADAVERLRQAAPEQARQARRQARQRTKRDPGSEFPEDWVIGNAELKVANDVARWDYDKAEDEFAKFKNWHLDKGNLSSNWHKAWETWCVRGRDYQPRRRRDRGGMDSVVEGLQQWAAHRDEWLEQQKRKRTRH
jgi:DNA-binding MarR family transcriptional regulator